MLPRQGASPLYMERVPPSAAIPIWTRPDIVHLGMFRNTFACTSLLLPPVGPAKETTRAKFTHKKKGGGIMPSTMPVTLDAGQKPRMLVCTLQIMYALGSQPSSYDWTRQAVSCRVGRRTKSTSRRSECSWAYATRKTGRAVRPCRMYDEGASLSPCATVVAENKPRQKTRSKG